jgi:hypothetical protein
MRAVLICAGLCAATALAACHRAQPATATHEQIPAFRSFDVGAGMLADVDNARQAIASGERLAAVNDLDRGLNCADQLAGDASTLFPDNASSARRGGAAVHAATAPAPARLSRFAAEVRMQSADAAMDRGDVADADKQLEAIQASVPAQSLPASWPLMRAQESLDVAAVAPSGDQPSALPTELKIAQAELAQYKGGVHRADANALAGEIDRAMARPGGAASIAPDRLSSWASKVGGWI